MMRERKRDMFTEIAGTRGGGGGWWVVVVGGVIPSAACWACW